MLPAPHRLRSPADFQATTRRGRKSAQPHLVLYVLRAAGDDSPAAGSPARAGLVVGKAVGNAVVRHQVSRRLRHVLRAHVHRLPAGSRLVVRALPAAATASSAALDADLARALDALLPARPRGTAS